MLVAGFNFFIGMFNFIPLLPLDGGHIAGALWEALRRGWARLRGRPDPGYVDVARLLPIAYCVAACLLVMGMVLIVGDLVVPVRLRFLTRISPVSENPGTQPGRPARVLTVGAYERDNFGDLLFLLVTERYLAGSEVVASAPFAADMTELLDRRVVALGDELTDNDIDAVWTVGGQVGGTTVGSAFRMSKSRKEYAAYMASPPAEQREILKAALHGAPLASPYVPTPGCVPAQRGGRHGPELGRPGRYPRSASAPARGDDRGRPDDRRRSRCGTSSRAGAWASAGSRTR